MRRSEDESQPIVQDRRKNRRVRLGVPVECRAGSVVINGTAENLSVCGLLVRAHQTFPAGAEISAVFALPGSEHLLEVRALVRHVVPEIFMGMEFVAVSTNVAELIENYVAGAVSIGSASKKAG